MRYWDGSRWTEWTNPAPPQDAGHSGAAPARETAGHDTTSSDTAASETAVHGEAAPAAGGPGTGLPGVGHYGGGYAEATYGPAAGVGPQVRPALLERPVAGLGRAIGVMMLVAAGLSVVAVVSDLAEMSLLRDLVDDPGSVSDEQVLANDARQGILGLLRYVLFLSTAITFLVWFHRVYTQPSLSRERLRFSPGWAVGAWFVPILSWFRPKQMMDDVWRASAPPPAYGQVGHDPDRVPGVLHAWWALWLLSGFLAGIEASLRANAELVERTVEAFQAASGAIFLADLLDIPLAIVAYQVVTQVTRRVAARQAQPHPGQPGYGDYHGY